MVTILKSNGKRGNNLLEWDDVTVIEHYKKAKKILAEIQHDYEAAKSENKAEAVSSISIYLVNVKELEFALANEIKYRELEWED